jgi:uncharacterized membrane protein YoaK (UPF0700 family)
MLSVKLLLLIVGAVLAIWLGPFTNGNGWPAIFMGMTLVSAMAIQNAVHRIHLGTAPPTTLMTGTTTQIMIDIANVIHGLPPNTRDATRARLRRLCTAMGTFAVGAATGAFLFGTISTWCFIVPPLVALLTRLTATSVSADSNSTPFGPRTAVHTP